MNTSIQQIDFEMATDGFDEPPCLQTPRSLDRSLTELSSGRRLEKITSSIEGFLLNQIARLNKSLDKCKQAVDQDKIVQRIMSDFERQKLVWEKERQTEIKRLVEAGDNLILGWKQLEQERQAFLSERGPGVANGKYRME